MPPIDRFWRRTVPILLGLLITACGGSSKVLSPTPSPTPTATQAWADEFNGPANSLPDPAKWTYDLGNNAGWGNRELETYTNLPENVHLDGVLMIDHMGLLKKRLVQRKLGKGGPARR